MQLKNTIAFNQWARRHRAFFALLLSVTVLFNAAHVFAAMDMQHESRPAASAMSAQMHMLGTSCCVGHTQHQSDCCQGAGCSCMAHCAALWLSQTFPLLQNGYKANPHFLAENTPASYINPPPKLPPRS